MVKEVQTTEVREVEVGADGENVRRQSVTTNTKPSGVVVAQRVVWYLVGVIVAFLLLRIVLQVLGANQGAGFVDFVYTVSNIFAAPFYGIFNYQPSYGTSYLEVSTVVAVIVYVLVGWGIAKLLTVARPRDEV